MLTGAPVASAGDGLIVVELETMGLSSPCWHFPANEISDDPSKLESALKPWISTPGNASKKARYAMAISGQNQDLASRPLHLAHWECQSAR